MKLSTVETQLKEKWQIVEIPIEKEEKKLKLLKFTYIFKIYFALPINSHSIRF